MRRRDAAKERTRRSVSKRMRLTRISRGESRRIRAHKTGYFVQSWRERHVCTLRHKICGFVQSHDVTLRVTPSPIARRQTRRAKGERDASTSCQISISYGASPQRREKRHKKRHICAAVQVKACAHMFFKD